MLPPHRLPRFARHIVLPEIGGAGQVALSRAHIMMIGCGGIGSPALQYLAAAGVGQITLVDDDRVDESNLQRQTLFTLADIGRPKTEAACGWLRRFDPEIRAVGHTVRIGPANAAALFADAGPAGGPPTLVLDGSDNYATRLAVSDACVAAGLPLISAAVGRFQGQIGNFAGHLPGQACYRCFVGDVFDADDCDSCAVDGVLGAFVGTVGAFAAMSAIRVVLAGAGIGIGIGHAGEGAPYLGDPQWGRLHIMDGLMPALRSVLITPDPTCRARHTERQTP